MTEESNFTGIDPSESEDPDFSNFDFTIGIIGGLGAMGRWFGYFFENQGINVMISDKGTPLTNKDLAQKADVLFLSVPMDVMPQVIEETGPLLSKDQLLMDVGSLKKEIVSDMLAKSKSQVLGAHPLFGPFSDSIFGQNIIFCPARGDKWVTIFKRIFEISGARVTILDPDTHDRNMAVFQGLTHFINITMGRTLQKLNLPLDHVKHSSTPVFRVSLDLVGRLFSQDPDLYAQIIGKNPYVTEVMDAFAASLTETRSYLLNGGDGKTYINEIRDFLGEYCDKGFKESNSFLNALYKKDNGVEEN